MDKRRRRRKGTRKEENGTRVKFVNSFNIYYLFMVNTHDIIISCCVLPVLGQGGILYIFLNQGFVGFRSFPC